MYSLYRKIYVCTHAHMYTYFGAFGSGGHIAFAGPADISGHSNVEVVEMPSSIIDSPPF